MSKVDEIKEDTCSIDYEFEYKRLQKENNKIKEKLEDLEKQYKEALEENSTQAFILKCQIEILKELLKGK